MADEVKSTKIPKVEIKEDKEEKEKGHPLVLEANIALAEDPFDLDAWGLILEVAARSPMEEGRKLYERFLAQFPTSGKYWKVYIDAEMAALNYDRVEKLFPRCLLTNKCLDINLWKTYINYIKMVKKGLADELSAVEAGYEFVLKHMGLDLDAASIWLDYLRFVRTSRADSAFEKNEKITKQRRIFQRCISLPLNSVDAIWREYDVFEHNLNKTLAKDLLAAAQPAHLAAKSTARDRKRYRMGIALDMVARPPTLSTQERVAQMEKDMETEREEKKSSEGGASAGVGSSGGVGGVGGGGVDDYLDRLAAEHAVAAAACRSSGQKEIVQDPQREFQQVVLWRRLINWEKSNPQRLDPPTLKSRVIFTYRQALMTLRHYPEVWYEYALYQLEAASPAAQSGLSVTRDPLAPPASIGGSAGPALDDAAAILTEAIDAAPSTPMHLLLADFHEERKNLSDARAIYQKLIDTQSKDGKVDPLVYIELMRFSRRTEGVEPARKVFVQARKHGAVSHHTFIAAARMEWHQNAAVPVAAKIFNFGMKDFAHEVEFVVSYLDFLHATNDHNNLRVVLERLLTANAIPADKLGPVWDRFLALERSSGDIVSMQRAEQRRRQADTSTPHHYLLDL